MKTTKRQVPELLAMIAAFLKVDENKRPLWSLLSLSLDYHCTERAFLHAMRKAIQGYSPDARRMAAVTYPERPTGTVWTERHDQMLSWWKRQFGKSHDPRWAPRMHAKKRTKDALAPALTHALKVLQVSEEEFKARYNLLFAKPEGEVFFPEFTRL